MSSDAALPESTQEWLGNATSRSSTGEQRRIVVVYVTDNMHVGGTELNAVRTAERLDRQRFDLRVVCLGGDGPLTDRYRAIGVPVVKMPIRNFYSWSMLRSGIRFVRYVRGARADIVHAHDVYSNIFAAVWAPMARVPVLITSRRWWHSLPNRKLQIGNRLAFQRASAVLANSAQVANSVREEAHIQSTKLWTITNFADESAFSSPSQDEIRRRRDEWRVPENSVVIGCVARFDRVKDHVTLIRAFARLRLRRPEARLVLVGDGETRSAIEALLTELELHDAVHLTGEVRNRGNLHHGFDISVLSSRSEGFPNTLVEAMAAGNPVVATRVGGCMDAVVDGKTGFLVSVDRPDELALALERLVESPALRRQFGQHGQARAQQHYWAPHVIAALQTMYVRLVGRGAA